MSKPIYPAIVPGLKVRHRRTLEERTVGEPRVSQSVRFRDGDGSFPVSTFWTYYEPLPQPGDRVRVVRSAWGCVNEADCRKRTGVLPESDGGADPGYTFGDHYGPLSDFEVILPEESETNMTDFPGHSLPNTTMTEVSPLGDCTPAQVNAALAAFNALPDTATKAEVRSAVDKAIKPKPRLVAVNLDDIREAVRRSDPALYDALAAQPGLLDTLDGVADGLKARGWLNDMGVLNLKDDFRIALGSDR